MPMDKPDPLPKQQLSKRAENARKRELQEQRQFGLAPLERDVRTGEEISPLIPNMISDAPFYLGTDGPTLQHQRLRKEMSDVEAIQGGETVVVTGQATRFRAGACPNCGAMGHKAKECTRPKRKIGAVYSNANIEKDTAVVDSSGVQAKTYQQKRDTWAKVGKEEYDEQWHRYGEEDKLIEKRLRIEESAAKERERINATGRGLFAAVAGDNVSSLRDIDDVPKYLQNLSQDDVFFDAKTRSMRANPHGVGGGHGGSADASQALYRGDNAMYEQSKGYIEELERQQFLFEHKEIASSFLATETEMSFLHWRERRRAQADIKAKALEALYGAEEAAPDADETAKSNAGLIASSLRNSQSSQQQQMISPNSAGAIGDAQQRQESSATASHAEAASAAPPSPSVATAAGAAVTGMEKLAMRAAQAAAKELATAQTLGHTTIFGSHFDRTSGKWGYRCCEQLDESARCTAAAS